VGKVRRVGGRPMVCAVLDACVEAGCGRLIVVVGHGQELVREALAGYRQVEFAVQQSQQGTGDAVAAARPHLEREIETPGSEVFVLCGDGPLIQPATLRALLEAHRRAGACATLATAILEDPTGYGRIVRDGAGRFSGIVEQKNATEAERRIREVNPSYYCFEAGPLFAALERVERNPVSGEFYLTDAPGLLAREGGVVEVVTAVPPEDVLSINTPEELERVDRIFRSRVGSSSGRHGAASGREAT